MEERRADGCETTGRKYAHCTKRWEDILRLSRRQLLLNIAHSDDSDMAHQQQFIISLGMVVWVGLVAYAIFRGLQTFHNIQLWWDMIFSLWSSHAMAQPAIRSVDERAYLNTYLLAPAIFSGSMLDFGGVNAWVIVTVSHFCGIYPWSIFNFPWIGGNM